jgi:quercetin dioxygenase-like cupin family protein
MGLGVLCAAVLGGCTDPDHTSDAHQHTAGSGIVGTILASSSLGDAEVDIKWQGLNPRVEGPTTLVMQEITFQPGGHTGWHIHGGMAFASIVSGALTLFAEGAPCVGQEYPGGTAFVDPGNRVHIAHNLGTSTAVVRVQYINPTGAPVRIDAPAPAGAELCP